MNQHPYSLTADWVRACPPHTQWSTPPAEHVRNANARVRVQVGATNCSSVFLRVICLAPCLRRGSGYGSSAPCWATGVGWEKMAHYNHATLSNAHTRVYSSSYELETGLPIKGIYYSFARPRKEEGPRGHLGRDGVSYGTFPYSSAGSV